MSDGAKEMRGVARASGKCRKEFSFASESLSKDRSPWPKGVVESRCPDYR